MLLTVVQTNELLLKNHNLRPSGSTIVPKAHASSDKSFSNSRGYGRGQSCGFQRGGDIFDPNN